jgi:hypothetical protein
LPFMRPAFSMLHSTFHWMARSARNQALPPEVVDELLVLASTVCYACSDITLPVDPVPVATDASEGGGGSCYASSLSAEALAEYSGVLKRPEVPDAWTPGHQAAYSYCIRAAQNGSDVRLDSGSLLDPRSWPREPARMHQWEWKVLQAYPFRISSHINVLETRAIFNYVRYRLKRREGLRARILIFSDSQVAISVVSKGRSSSLQLNNVLRRLGGLVVLCNLRICLCWCRSGDNPADKPSRNKW